MTEDSIDTEIPKFLDDIDALWQPVIKLAKLGQDVTLEVSRIGATVELYEGMVKGGDFPSHWIPAVYAARSLHENNIRWVGQNAKQLAEWHSYWQERLTSNERFTLGLVTDGMKYVLALHGATAITSLNLLMSERGEAYRSVLLVGLFGSVVGILMIGGGIIVLVNILAKQYGTVRGRLINKKGWRALSAIPRWMGVKFDRQLKLVDFLVYGSIIWFGIYSGIGFALLLSR